MTPIEKSIRENFPGPNNASLRARLRAEAEKDGNVICLRHSVALSYGGELALAAVQEVISAAKLRGGCECGTITGQPCEDGPSDDLIRVSYVAASDYGSVEALHGQTRGYERTALVSPKCAEDLRTIDEDGTPRPYYAICA